MKLVEPTAQHIVQLMQWFSSQSELRSWAGPKYTYPYDELSFTRDLDMNSLPSFSLVSKESELVAFGQCYQRVNRCHFGRLAVSPEHRGKGIAATLVDSLAVFGMEKFGVTECSLFVYPDNFSAVKAYLKQGFELAQYPEKMPMENCLYMVK